MATFAKMVLSGSTNGKGIKVVATSSAGTTIHTAVTGTSSWDEIWIYAYNSNSVAENLTLQWGGTSSPDDSITVTLQPYQGLMLVVPGLVLQNSLVLKAFATDANVVIIHGFVNRIT
jgi:hypothetical protein